MNYFVSFLVFAIFLMRKRERASCFVLIVLCLANVNALWLFCAVPWFGLQCVIEEFPNHTQLLFELVP